MSSTSKETLITVITTLGVAVGVFAIGYSFGKDTNEGTISFIREKYQTLEKTESQLLAENTALKIAIQGANAPSSHPAAVQLGSLAKSDTPASGSIVSKPKAEISPERISLQNGHSGEAYNGQLTLSLVGTPFEGNPLRYKVVATVGGPGKANQTLDKVDVGFAVQFDGYEVRVLSVEPFSATFLVTKLKPKEEK